MTTPDTQTETPASTETDEEATVVATKREPTEYEKELRRENRKAREKHNQELAAIKAQHEEMVANLSKSAQQKLVRAELKASAIKAGIIDADLLSLIDINSVKLSPEGDVLNAQEVLDNFRAAKPHLFGSATTTSTTEAPRPKADSSPKLYKDMSEPERKAFRRQNGLAS
jgi:hypothetical protein